MAGLLAAASEPAIVVRELARVQWAPPSFGLRTGRSLQSVTSERAARSELMFIVALGNIVSAS